MRAESDPKSPFWEQIPRHVFIYGTGRFAKDIQRVLQQKEVTIAGFIDRRKDNLNIAEGIPVFQPDAESITQKERADSVVLLGIHNREAKVLPIITNLKQLGYREIISPIDLYDYLREELGVRYWLTSRSYYVSHRPAIETVGDLFTDEASRQIFTFLMRFRLTGDYSLLPLPDTDRQYFPEDLPKWTQPLRFVDCGAYDGDTLAAFLGADHRFEALAAFEPDQANFHQLASYVAQRKAEFPNAALFPCGVYSQTTQLAFETGAGEASKATGGAAGLIQCVSLNESIPSFAPHLIKMDIEGAEMDALLGATTIISTYQPALAISVYHTPAHIWEIPLYISRFAEENKLRYSFHLRAHAHNCFDTVFYAIPEGNTI